MCCKIKAQGNQSRQYVVVQYTKYTRPYKINEYVIISIYNCILQHPQVFQPPIANYGLKFFIDGQAEPQLVPKLLLQLSFRELHNSMVGPPKEGGPKETIEEEDNATISY